MESLTHYCCCLGVESENILRIVQKGLLLYPIPCHNTGTIFRFGLNLVLECRWGTSWTRCIPKSCTQWPGLDILVGLSLDSWSCRYGNFRSLLFASSLVVLECFLSPFLLGTCLGGPKGTVIEINSATSKTLHGVGCWAIRSILGLEFQDL